MDGWIQPLKTAVQGNRYRVAGRGVHCVLNMMMMMWPRRNSHQGRDIELQIGSTKGS